MSQNHNFINSVVKTKPNDVLLLPSGQLIKHFRLSLLKQSDNGACIMPNIFSYKQLYANLYCFYGFCKGLDLSEIAVASQLEMLASFEKIGVSSPSSFLSFFNSDPDKFKEKFTKVYERLLRELNSMNLHTLDQANAIALQRIKATWVGGKNLNIVQSNEASELTDFFKDKANVSFYKPTITGSATHSILECENIFEESSIVSFYIREQLEKCRGGVVVVCEDRNLTRLIENKLAQLNISTRGYTKKIIDTNSYSLLNAIINFDEDFKLSLIRLLRSYLSRFKAATELSELEMKYLRKPNEVESFDELPVTPEFEKLAKLFALINGAKTFKDFTVKVFDIFNYLASFELIDSYEADALIKLKDEILDSKCNFTNQQQFKHVFKLLANSQVISTPQIHEPQVEFITLDQLEFLNPKVLVVAGANTDLIKERVLLDSFTNCFLTYAKLSIDEEKDPCLFYPVSRRSKYHAWLEELNSYHLLPTSRPAPGCLLRPSKYSASSIELLMKDPYIFYTKYILKLKELEAVNLKPSRREFGLAMHHALSKLTIEDHKDERKFKDKISNEFRAFLVNEHIKMKPYWEQKMIRVTAELFKYFTGCDFVAEVAGERSLIIEGQSITLTMRADRIDHSDVKVIYDYKTGAVPSNIDVRTGRKPQLLIGAYVFNFEPTPRINYLELVGKKHVIEAIDVKYDLQEVEAGLTQLFTTYMKSNYFAQIHFNQDIPWSYRHINRYDEWYN